ncbi:hypothetical protein [Methylibium petroleiphilum]|uniref:Uncharacterized protein n=1 Tax=Methylibium petroleiphilum (strain ATCC BAA-1232 / LMG 22953 / PM1) TaxID=420662 RepID=A2SF09_METPP|nr:hypothetical protein [Methylibium petroleiphilum]ABM94148.1 hypothetical protein Mpe_A1186 [Methylibium petroleiphilum PM1]ABM96956.1 hypothetical protein Mpe_B0180 [Methylibium petroleiphilum PM1]
MGIAEGFYANVTLTDVLLASAYYPILVDLAKHKHRLTYGELVERAKAEYPERPVVQKAIAVSTGRRLDVVRMFTSERGLPDLTSLVINKGSGECGSGFTRHFDPVAARERVFEFDWSTVSLDFACFVKSTEVAVQPRKRVKEPRARELMAIFYQQHKATLPPAVRDRREVIVELIMEGFAEHEAFALAIRDVG